MSFAFYLVHELVIFNLRDHLGHRAVVETAVLFAVSVIAAMALHHTVEQPAERAIRGDHRLAVSDG